jgi:hypothetical protein
MSGSRIAEVERALAASRAAADERLVQSLRQAQRLEAGAAEAVVETGGKRIARLRSVAASIATESAAIESASERLAEAMASASDRLAELCESAPEPSAWHSGLDETVARNLELGR